ncbi:hypothetical protein HYX07_05655 [Candidatus Woesearchaeota archaeon]|nr:hypothetical protein [Candidatus Woesearchaeota archaeon]
MKRINTKQASIENKPRKITTGKDIWNTMKFSKSTEELMREVDEDFGLD